MISSAAPAADVVKASANVYLVTVIGLQEAALVALGSDRN